MCYKWFYEIALNAIVYASLFTSSLVFHCFCVACPQHASFKSHFRFHHQGVSMVRQINQFLLMPCFIFIFFIAHLILSPVNDSFVCFCINKQQRVTTASHLLRQVDSPTANTRANKVYVRLSLQNNPIVGLAHEEL